MSPKHLPIISRCIEEGCRYGVALAHKHTEDPSYEQIEEDVHSAIMERLHEMYEFPAECSENRKSLLEKLSLLEGAKFNRNLFYGDAIESVRMMEHEVCPEDARDGGLSQTPSSVDLGYGDGGTSHNSSTNVKEHATLSAGASVNQGVMGEATEDHKNRAADRGCVSRLVRDSSFPCNAQKDDLSKKGKVNSFLRETADDLGFVGVILCLGIVWVTWVLICHLWSIPESIINPSKPVEHQNYQKDLDDRENAGKINNPRVIRRANNRSNSHNNSGKDSD